VALITPLRHLLARLSAMRREASVIATVVAGLQPDV